MYMSQCIYPSSFRKYCMQLLKYIKMHKTHKILKCIKIMPVRSRKKNPSDTVKILQTDMKFFEQESDMIKMSEKDSTEGG